MPAVPFRPRLGERVLVALSCAACGALKAGDQYDRRPRLPGGPAYIDRRCRACRWARMEANPGRNSSPDPLPDVEARERVSS